MNKRSIFLWLFLVIFSGCTVGTPIHEFRPAKSPYGVNMKVRLHGDIVGGSRLEGELLAAHPDSILLNVVSKDGANGLGRVTRIPYWMMEVVEPDQMGYVKVSAQSQAIDEERLRRLRAVSRFPQGLSDELLAKLLAAMGQDEVDHPQRR